MSMKRIYKCDICGESPDRPVLLFGIRFSNGVDFTLSGYGSTDGKHICYNCANQLLKHLNSEPIKKELADYIYAYHSK